MIILYTSRNVYEIRKMYRCFGMEQKRDSETVVLRDSTMTPIDPEYRLLFMAD